MSIFAMYYFCITTLGATIYLFYINPPEMHPKKLSSVDEGANKMFTYFLKGARWLFENKSLYELPPPEDDGKTPK